MSILVDVTSTPQTFTTGNWPYASFGAYPWQMTITPSFASSSMVTADEHYLVQFRSNESVVLYHNGTQPTLRVKLVWSDAFKQFPLSWSAGQTITLLFDPAAKTIEITGASPGAVSGAGAGIWEPHASAWTNTADGTLYTGQSSSATKIFNGSISDIVAPSIVGAYTADGTGTAAVPVSGSASAAFVDLAAEGVGGYFAGEASAALFDMTAEAVGGYVPVPTSGNAIVYMGAYEAYASGELYQNITVYAHNGTTYPDDEALPIDDDGKTVRISTRILNAVLLGDLLTYDDEVFP